LATEVALLLSVALLVTVTAAMFSRSMSVTIIMLFYASLILGVIFTLFQGVLVGLLHIITFAGAISVLLLTIVLMTGESNLSIGNRTLAALIGTITILVVLASSYPLFGGMVPTTETTAGSTMGLLTFVWTDRPWDLLILIVVFAAAMIGIVNLLSEKK